MEDKERKKKKQKKNVEIIECGIPARGIELQPHPNPGVSCSSTSDSKGTNVSNEWKE